MGVPACTGSSPAIRRIPRPPAAASAAGGRGIHGSRYVNSLGVRCGVAAGGAGVEVVAPECLLWRWSSPPSVRLRGSFAADLPSSPCSRLPGVVERAPPSPESERRRIRRLTFEGVVAGGQVGAVVLRAGWRCFGTEGRRLPSRAGGPPSPRLWRSCGGFRRRNVQLEDDDARAQEDLVVIFYVFWAFL